MTEYNDTHASDSMTQAELMAKLMEAYDVPIDLIRYERIQTDTQHDGMVGPTDD